MSLFSWINDSNLNQKEHPSGRSWQICGAQVVCSPSGPVLDSATLVVEDGHVTDILKEGKRDDLPVIDGAGYLVIPGLINAHTHASMSFFRGLAHLQSAKAADHSIIEDFFFPVEKSLTPELIGPLSYSYLVDGLRSGVTCFVDAYFDSIEVGYALERIGIRGVIGEHIADLGGAKPAGEPLWRKVKETIAAWPFTGLVKPLVYAHAADTVSRPLLTELAAFARDQRLPLHMHLSQTAGERARVVLREKMSPVQYAKECGALSRRSLVVHLVSADEEDCRILRGEGATIGLCPVSEILYEALPPLKLFFDHDIPMALGTDSAASNDGADMLREMHTMAVLAKHLGIAREKISAAAILAMATTSAARVLDLQDAGEIKKGGAADLVFLKTDITTYPCDQVIANLIFSFKSEHVRHVMIDGAWALWQREPVKAREADLFAEYKAAVKAVKKRAGL